jgi:hypothetical protein
MPHAVLRPIRRYRVLIAFLQIFILVHDKMDTRMRGCIGPHYHENGAAAISCWYPIALCVLIYLGQSLQCLPFLYILYRIAFLLPHYFNTIDVRLLY